MRLLALLLGFVLLFSAGKSQAQAHPNLVLIGKIPGQYLKFNHHGKETQVRDNQSYLGYLVIEARVISKIRQIKLGDLKNVESLYKNLGYKVVTLKRKRKFDIIYPGLIDLHGHNKQNMLPTWTTAFGRFANRYEWRTKSNEYDQVQGNNMNPWVDNTTAQVAAFRWAELQAMVLGTTYLQGKIIYDKGFAIHSVEDSKAYISERSAVKSGGDIIDPFKWSFLWTTLRPIMQKLGCENSYDCYKKSVSQFLAENCFIRNAPPEEFFLEVLNLKTGKISYNEIQAAIPTAVIRDVSAPESVDWLLALKEKIKVACPVKNADEMLNFLSYKFGNLPHKEIVNKNAYLDSPKRAAIVTHLAEGRRKDPVTWSEFQLLKLAGLAREGMNFIHGVALTREDFKYMAENNMGLVWSPYSNFLLYGETTDIKLAMEEGVRIALGSDWSPTGSKSVLDELKVARDYLADKKLKFSDRDLYNMVTSHSAEIINHYGFEGPTERGVGTLEEGSMGTVIVTANKKENPYTNLVEFVRAGDINMVVIDGEPIYGNMSYIRDYDSLLSVEKISGRVFRTSLEENPQAFPENVTYSTIAKETAVLLGEAYAAAGGEETLTSPEKTQIRKQVEKKAKAVAKTKLKEQSHIIVAKKAVEIELVDSEACHFSEDKVFVLKKSKDFEKRVKPLFVASGLDLDSYSGIARYLGVSLLSQSHNVRYVNGEVKYSAGAMKTVPPLYGCEDHGYLKYLTEMAAPSIENTMDRMKDSRKQKRKEVKLMTFFDEKSGGVEYSVPHELALQYNLVAPLKGESPQSPENFKTIIDIELERNF